MPRTPRPSSRQIFGSWVVLPDPVSPARTTTWWSRIAAPISSLRWLTGRAGGQLIRGTPSRRRSSRACAAATSAAISFSTFCRASSPRTLRTPSSRRRNRRRSCGIRSCSRSCRLAGGVPVCMSAARMAHRGGAWPLVSAYLPYASASPVVKRSQVVRALLARRAGRTPATSAARGGTAPPGGSCRHLGLGLGPGAPGAQPLGGDPRVGRLARGFGRQTPAALVSKPVVPAQPALLYLLAVQRYQAVADQAIQDAV